MALTERDKVAHLYRRFSFGGTLAEIEEGVTAGLDATIKKLVDYDSVPTNFHVHPYEFAWNEDEKLEAEPGTYRFRLWWIMAMAATNRPFQEKLALFWHSHFAVSEKKVENGPMMLDYMTVLRNGANGQFSDLLKSIAKLPAMMRYLDMERAFKGHPNENFAREVMELFTMGIGNYSEKDVQETSRALTGWGFIDTFYEGGKTNTERLMTLYRDKRSASTFCLMPTMRDAEPKTILGQTKDFDGDQVLEMLANRPETAKFICKKLWEFFAYDNPETAIVDKLAGVFIKSKGNIKQVMLAVATTPEFYGEKCYMKGYKSPADYVIGTVRQMNLGTELLLLRGKDANPTKALPKAVLDNVAAMGYYIGKAGLDVCYPDDVSGWKWGKNWINSATMTSRMQYNGMMIWDAKGPWVAAKTTQSMMAAGSPVTPEASTERFKKIFDLTLSPKMDELLVATFKYHTPTCYQDTGKWAGILYYCLKMLSACPDMHVC
jgi:uncharacterized protein (DUF1800 family)